MSAAHGFRRPRSTWWLAWLLLLAWPVAAEARAPRSDVLGITPGMAEAEAHRVLERWGRPERGGQGAEAEEEGEAREIWKLDHARFTWVVLAVRDERVRSVQGYLHKERRPLRYTDVGDLRRARRIGSWIYVWDVPARGRTPAIRVEARGADPRFPGSYTVAASHPEWGEGDGQREAEDRARRVD